jgi:hypothetical protein
MRYRTVHVAARVDERLRRCAQLVAVARGMARRDAVELRQRRICKLGRLCVWAEQVVSVPLNTRPFLCNATMSPISSNRFCREPC